MSAVQSYPFLKPAEFELACEEFLDLVNSEVHNWDSISLNNGVFSIKRTAQLDGTLDLSNEADDGVNIEEHDDVS